MNRITVNIIAVFVTIRIVHTFLTTVQTRVVGVISRRMDARLRAALITITSTIAAYVTIRTVRITLGIVQKELPFIMALPTTSEMRLKREALNRVRMGGLGREFILLMIRILPGR